MAITCPICEAGSLVAGTKVATLRYSGAVLHVPNVAVSTCSECGEQMVLPEQARANDLKYADAKREHDGLWTSSRIAEWRMRWGLSQQEAAQLLGGGVNAFSKYERGEVMQSKAMDLLMRVYNDVPGVRDRLSALSGVVSSNGWTTDKSHSKTHSYSQTGTRRVDLHKFEATLKQFKPSAVGCQELTWDEEVAYGYGT